MKLLKKRPFSRILILLLVAVLTLSPLAMAADAWVLDPLVDAEALGLLTSEDNINIETVVSDEQMERICSCVFGSFAQIGMERQDWKTPVPVEGPYTRRQVLSLLQDQLGFCTSFDPSDESQLNTDSLGCMARRGVLRGDASGDYMLDRSCSFPEAAIFAVRFVTAVYDECGTGSKGLLWKATSGGNTLYLLGTIHVDRGNVYPFAPDLRGILSTADEALFEVDFLNMDGIAYFMQAQTYSDGTALSDHIDPVLYAAVVNAFEELGLPEEQTAVYKPWALANSLSSLSLQEDDGTDVMVIDSYAYSKALVNGVSIGEVEGYAFQADLFDSLSPAYQEAYLSACLNAYLAVQDAPGDGGTAADGAGLTALDAMLAAWKARDLNSFEAVYDKDAALASGDELTALLFRERDPHMTEAAAACLEAEGESTVVLIVGAGHMVGSGGIVESLRALGYTVELVA